MAAMGATNCRAEQSRAEQIEAALIAERFEKTRQTYSWQHNKSQYSIGNQFL